MRPSLSKLSSAQPIFNIFLFKKDIPYFLRIFHTRDVRKGSKRDLGHVESEEEVLLRMGFNWHRP